MMKFLLVFIFLVSKVSAEEPKGVINLFVMAGQSNMLGSKGFAKDYPSAPADLEKDKFIYLNWTIPSSKRTIVGINHRESPDWTQLESQAGIFGPEVTFARTAINHMNPVAIFKYSVGGTSLYYDWGGPGSGGLYDDMLAKLSDAFGKLRRRGHHIRIRGLIWVQGESDAEYPMMANQYYSRMRELIRHFRASQGYVKLPVILGVDEQHPWVKKNPVIVKAQQQLSTEDNCIAATSMRGLSKADETHLNASGILKHGERLFSAWELLANRAGCN